MTYSKHPRPVELQCLSMTPRYSLQFKITERRYRSTNWPWNPGTLVNGIWAVIQPIQVQTSIANAEKSASYFILQAGRLNHIQYWQRKRPWRVAVIGFNVEETCERADSESQ
jgi:hypothetical protein